MKFEVTKEELNKQFPDLELTKGFYILNGEKKDDTRTSSQNNSLYLFFKQISDQCIEKGIDMREIILDHIPIECTPYNIKWMWKKLQYALFKTKSTTELKNNGQIDLIYDHFVKIISERTQGEVEVPPFPSKKEEAKNFKELDYPESNGEVKF